MTRDQLRFVLAELRELLHAYPKTNHTAGKSVCAPEDFPGADED